MYLGVGASGRCKMQIFFFAKIFVTGVTGDRLQPIDLLQEMNQKELISTFRQQKGNTKQG